MNHVEKTIESAPWIARRAAMVVLVVAGCMAQAACGNTNLGKVKDMKLEVDPSFTVGQAFDNRKVCDSVKWDAVKDERGRHIVEYRCYFKGVDDYVQAHIANEVKNLNVAAQAKKDEYIREMNELQKQLDEKKKQLSADQSAPGVTDAGSIDKGLRDQIQMLTDQAAVLNTGDVSKIAAITLDPKYGFKDMESAIQCYNTAAPGSVAQGKCSDDIKQAIPDTVHWMHEYSGQLQVAVQKDVAQTQGESNFDIATLQQQIPSYQGKLNEMVAGKDAFFASVDADLKKSLANEAPNPVEKADEVFQWSVSDEGDITLVYAGTEITYKDGTVKDQPYHDADVAMKLIAHNEAETYADYGLRIR